MDLVLAQGALRAGWHAHKLNAPGKFLVRSPEHDTPRRARAYLLTDNDVTSAAAHYAPARPQLDAVSRHALTIRPSVPPTVERTESDHSGITRTETGENPEATLIIALSAAPEEGISVPELVAATGMSRRWIYYRLRDLASAGQVIQTMRGQWRTAPRSRP